MSGRRRNIKDRGSQSRRKERRGKEGHLIGRGGDEVEEAHQGQGREQEKERRGSRRINVEEKEEGGGGVKEERRKSCLRGRKREKAGEEWEDEGGEEEEGKGRVRGG